MTKRINLALQGGGAHGAFTWGVLETILRDPDIEIAAITGTSAGALNGAAVKAGLVSGGPDAAIENLNWLWGQIMGIQDMRLNGWIAAMTPPQVQSLLEYTPGYQFFDAIGRMSSPYSYGPLYQNPLHRIVERFSYDAVCAQEGPDLFICATNVRTGKVRVFQGDEISTDSILASACLPTMFQAIEIDGDAYWDGGYTGNPALFPLYKDALPHDVLIVNINPPERSEIPRTPQDIQNRINEISFNSSLLRELRAIEFVQRLMDDGRVEEGAMKRLHVHMIADDALMTRLSVASKVVPQTRVILDLKKAGEKSAQSFLQNHKTQIGVTGTVDLRAMFA